MIDAPPKLSIIGADGIEKSVARAHVYDAIVDRGRGLNAAPIEAISCSASGSDVPGRSLPTRPMAPVGEMGPAVFSGDQNSTYGEGVCAAARRKGKLNPGGMTPITRQSWPLIVRLRPTTPRSLSAHQAPVGRPALAAGWFLSCSYRVFDSWYFFASAANPGFGGFGAPRNSSRS